MGSENAENSRVIIRQHDLRRCASGACVAESGDSTIQLLNSFGVTRLRCAAGSERLL